MKHLLIIQGKKYISSKRASKISDYSSDYIGQLCRSEKLDCKMVGHTWFVTEESLNDHKKKISSEEYVRARIQNFFPNIKTSSDNDKKISESTAKVLSTGDMPNDRISTARASEISGYTSDYIGQLCRSGKLQCKMIGNSWFVGEKSLRDHQAKISKKKTPSAIVLEDGKSKEFSSVHVSRPLSYFSDSRPLLPTLKTNIVRGFDDGDLFSKEISRKQPSRISKIVSRNSRLFLGQRNIIRRGVVFCLAATIFFAVISGSISILNRNYSSSVSRMSSASIYDAVQTITNALKEVYVAVASVLSPRPQLTVNSTPFTVTESADGKNGSYRGMAVTPGSDSATRDESIKQDIRNSFSDQVDIHPDESKTAGVINPVFRESKGKDFIYVLVPVKDKKTSSP